MPTVALTEKAESDLDAIYEHYEGLIGPDAARDVIVRVLAALDQLELFPGAGRPSLVPDVRELIIMRYPFIAPYRLMHGEIQVLRILHQRAERAEDW